MQAFIAHFGLASFDAQLALSGMTAILCNCATVLILNMGLKDINFLLVLFDAIIFDLVVHSSENDLS